MPRLSPLFSHRRFLYPSDKPSLVHSQRYNIDRGNALAQKLVAGWLCNDLIPDHVYDASGNNFNGTFNASGSHTFTWLPTERSIALKHNSTDGLIDIGDILDTGNYSEWTWVFRFLVADMPTANGNYAPWMVNAWSTSHGAGNLYIIAPYRSGGVNKMRILANAGSDYAESTIALSENIWYTCASGYDGSNIWVQIVGQESAQTDAASDPGSVSGTNIELLGSTYYWDYGLVGYLDWMYLFSFTVPSEMLSLLKNDPYQLMAMNTYRQMRN
jgi:hypothetical protein